MARNLAIVQDGYVREDPLSTLKLVEKPIPIAGADEVVVRLLLRPIHPADLIRLRTFGVRNGSAGAEGMGIIHQVGEGVKNVKKGQRVVPHTSEGRGHTSEGRGSWQEYMCVPAKDVWPVPDAMTDEQASQFIVNPWTAYNLMKQLLPVPPGKFIVLTAAGSTLGRMLVSLAAHWNIQFISIVRREAQKAQLIARNPHHQVVCSSKEDMVVRVKEITGGAGAWAALDAVSGAMTQRLGACMQDGGRIIVYGALGGWEATVNVMDLIRGVSVTGYTPSRELLKDYEQREACAAEVAPLVIDGIIPVAEVEKFEFSDFKQALRRAEEPGLSRKVLLASP